ncbi:hypothetical protein ACFLYD_02925 [Chloroflexota bacterium]
MCKLIHDLFDQNKEKKPMQESSLTHDEFQSAMQHVEKLLDRRQTTTSFYLSANAGILAVVGLLLSGTHASQELQSVSSLMLIGAGLIACWIWRSLLHQYRILLDWWYARLRDLEKEMPNSAKLVTQEYEDLYKGAEGRPPSQRIGMTKRELAFNLVFILLYIALAAGVLWNWLA